MKSKFVVFQIFLLILFSFLKSIWKKYQKNKVDNDTEYVNQEFSKVLSHNGSVHELTLHNKTELQKEKIIISRNLSFHIFVPKTY